MVNGQMTTETMKRLLCTKFDAWRYEGEYRAFAKLENSENGFFFGDFDPHLTLREVIVGIRSGATSADVSNAVGSLPNVHCIQAQLAFERFEVVASI
jgi:hypothetical protein